jgi:hypothetical protein
MTTDIGNSIEQFNEKPAPEQTSAAPVLLSTGLVGCDLLHLERLNSMSVVIRCISHGVFDFML